MPLIPHGWDGQASAWLAAHLRAFCLRRGGQAQPHTAPLSSARLLGRAESTEMGIIPIPQPCPHPAVIRYCFGAEVEGTNLCVPGASQGWREQPSPQTRQRDKPWGGGVVMGKVAQVSGIRGVLLVHGMGKRIRATVS